MRKEVDVLERAVAHNVAIVGYNIIHILWYE